jgi:hypothetical protein
MKNIINNGTSQHNNDKDKNAQTIPSMTLGFLGTALSLPPHVLPTGNNKPPEAPTCQLSINQLQKTFLNYTIVQNTQLPDKPKFLSTKTSSNCFR